VGLMDSYTFDFFFKSVHSFIRFINDGIDMAKKANNQFYINMMVQPEPDIKFTYKFKKEEIIERYTICFVNPYYNLNIPLNSKDVGFLDFICAAKIILSLEELNV
jgi:hypothetical protein